MNIALIVGGALAGFVVGLTGMGGGALMTPMLVFFFGVDPLAAVSSDLVASAVMKPFGSFVHLRRGTVNFGLVRWLALGSVPSAFLGVLALRAIGDDASIQSFVRNAMGVALLMATAGLVARAYIGLVERTREGATTAEAAPVRVRPLPTVAVGAVGGFMVGLTSVGSGSLIIVALLALYPTLNAGRLVGTDLVQAVPLVFSAAIGHLLFGDFQFGVTSALLIGAIPGVLLGARVSSQANSGLVRRALAVVLLASGLKLLGVATGALVVIVVVAVAGGTLAWMGVRRLRGLSPLARREAVAAQETSTAPVSEDHTRSGG